MRFLALESVVPGSIAAGAHQSKQAGNLVADRARGELRRLTHGHDPFGSPARTSPLPVPDRLRGQRRYATDVVGKLAFIGIAQSAGFKLSEIKNLVQSIECALFAAPGEKPAETDLALTVVHVEGGDCRRASEWA